MNAFDLRAVGWVIVRDTYGDMVRAWLGRDRRIDPRAFPELVRRWEALRGACPQPSSPLDLSAMTRTAALPNHREEVVRFVAALRAASPAHYSPDALRARLGQALVQAAVGFAGSALCVPAGATGADLLRDCAFILLLMGLCSLIAAVQLWRVRRLVAHGGKDRTPAAARERAPYPAEDRAPRNAP